MAEHPSFQLADPARTRGPLATWRAAFAALPSSVHLAQRPGLVQLNVRATDAEAAAAMAAVLGHRLPVEPCTARNVGHYELLWLGPDEWLVLSEPGDIELESTLRAAIGDRAGAVTDVSAQRTALTLSGPAAAEVLARGCAIDLHPSRAPRGTCVQTLLARTGIIITVADDTATRFELLVRASFADYLAEWLVDACAEVSP